MLTDLGWTVTAWQKETFGELGLLGHENKTEIILKRSLLAALEKQNSDLPKRHISKRWNIRHPKFPNFTLANNT